MSSVKDLSVREGPRQTWTSVLSDSVVGFSAFSLLLYLLASLPFLPAFHSDS